MVVRCYTVLLQCNPFTPLGVADIALRLHRSLHLLCGVSLCLAAASTSHFFPLLASYKSVSGVAVAVLTYAITVSMVSTGMAI